VKAKQPEPKPTPVSPRPLADAAKQVGDVRDRWSWIEPCAWTKRMLTALESGVKGDKWFSLIDKVYDRVHLRAAFGRVARNDGAAGVDRVSVERYEARLHEKSLKKFKDTIRRKKRRRCSGQSLSHIIDDVNRTLRGWFEYFQHSSNHDHLFHNLDAWLRMRLRSILCERLGLRGRGRGIDHQRWRNSFFTEQGLFSLKAAHASACQSSLR